MDILLETLPRDGGGAGAVGGRDNGGGAVASPAGGLAAMAIIEVRVWGRRRRRAPAIEGF
jgi:hypothetical protein